MSEIKVTIGQLHSKSEELKALNESFKSSVNSLDETELALVAMWDGEAKEAFHRAFTHDKECMEKYYNVIAQYACVLDQIAAKYAQAESHNTSIVGNDSSKIPIASNVIGHSAILTTLRYASPSVFWNSKPSVSLNF